MCKECVPTSNEELGKFIHGLNDRYRMTVINTQPDCLEDAINKALKIEDLEKTKL